MVHLEFGGGDTGSALELLRIVLQGQRLFSEWLLRKDGGTVGWIRDTRTCVGMEVRVRTQGGQSRRRASCGTGPAWTGCCMRRVQGLDQCDTCVRMWVQGLGRGWAAVHRAAGQGRSAVMAQDCVGVVELSAAGVQRCVQRLSIMWGRTVYSCVHLCTQGTLSRTGSRRHRRRDRRALLSMWETRTSEDTGGPEQNVLKLGNYVGSGRACSI